MMFHWTSEIRLIFINCIASILVAEGSNADNGLKKQTWQKILKEFNKAADLNLQKAQLQSQVSLLFITLWRLLIIIII
jgi:hypothetical protein